jgi:hypothetical protein
LSLTKCPVGGKLRIRVRAHGTFEFSREDLETDFHNVLESHAYNEAGRCRTSHPPVPQGRPAPFRRVRSAGSVGTDHSSRHARQAPETPVQRRDEQCFRARAQCRRRAATPVRGAAQRWNARRSSVRAPREKRPTTMLLCSRRTFALCASDVISNQVLVRTESVSYSSRIRGAK